MKITMNFYQNKDSIERIHHLNWLTINSNDCACVDLKWKEVRIQFSRIFKSTTYNTAESKKLDLVNNII